MARSRSLPTTLFEDPDFFELESDAQVILIGLVLLADDHGRGLAHSGLLSRKLNKAEPLIEATLIQLAAQQLLCCYADEHQRYYALTRWWEWETLSKPARSKYPEPPSMKGKTSFPQAPEKPQIPQEKLGESWDALHEEEEEREKEEEEEEKPQGTAPAPVVAYLAPSSDGGIVALSHEQVRETTKQVARILKLAQSESLSRLVTEYLPTPGLSLLGEADAAREWIDDPRRNRQRARMSPAFFRRWLKREQAAMAEQAKRAQATGTEGKQEPAGGSEPAAPPGLSRRSLMNLEAEYRAQRAGGKAP